jgi:hypothetical protein
MLLAAHTNTQHQITQWLVNTEMKEVEGSIYGQVWWTTAAFPSKHWKTIKMSKFDPFICWIQSINAAHLITFVILKYRKGSYENCRHLETKLVKNSIRNGPLISQ